MSKLLEQYLTVEEVARVLRKSTKTVYRYISEGLPSSKIGKTHLVHREDLNTWIKKRRR